MDATQPMPTTLWDGNVAGMREEKNGQNGWSNLSDHPDTSYYLQDELGSPIRLLDEEGNMRETYGYDEFGQDLYRNQGQIQPFGYTGYQSDQIAETYYAQAREYRAELGRFAERDALRYSSKGNISSLNLYVYCMQNPLYYIDFNGHETIVVSGGTADTDEFDYQFIETAIKNINDLNADGVPVEDITWLSDIDKYDDCIGE